MTCSYCQQEWTADHTLHPFRRAIFHWHQWYFANMIHHWRCSLCGALRHRKPLTYVLGIFGGKERP
jgi:hypothetical protein